MNAALLEKDQLIELVTQQSERIAVLEQQLRIMASRHYGRKSETIPAEQYSLFQTPLEAEPQDNDTQEPQALETITYTRKKRGKRTGFDPNLERRRIDYEIPPEQRQCHCGGELIKIDEIITQQVEMIPAQYFVIDHVQHKYACPCCQQNVQLAAKPPQPLEKSYAAAGLLAYIATTKYVDGVPLHRQEKQHARGGIHIPRNSMARWLIKLADLILPLVNLFEEAIRAGPYIQCDETPHQVLKEPGRKADAQSYMWVRRGGAPDKPVVIYRYFPNRSSAVAQCLFEDYQGYVQCDGYSAYRCLEEQGITLVGCMAHARRKFNDALKGLSKKEVTQKSKAMAALKFIKRLYIIEDEIKSLSIEQRYQVRQEKALPILSEFKAWLDAQHVLPKSLLGKAINYSLNQWPRLIRYCENGYLPIDNNADERAIRPLAIGRKNYLFSDTQNGAHTNARFYSLIETCKLHGQEPYAYLKHIFKELPKATTVEQVEALLPWNCDAKSLREMAREG